MRTSVLFLLIVVLSMLAPEESFAQSTIPKTTGGEFRECAQTARGAQARPGGAGSAAQGAGQAKSGGGEEFHNLVTIEGGQVQVRCLKVKEGEAPKVVYCLGKGQGCTIIPKSQAGKWYEELVDSMSYSPELLKGPYQEYDEDGEVNLRAPGVVQFSAPVDPIMNDILGNDAWYNYTESDVFDGVTGKQVGRISLLNSSQLDRTAGDVLRYIADETERTVNIPSSGFTDDPGTLFKNYQQLQTHNFNIDLKNISNQYQSIITPKAPSPFDYYQSFTPPARPATFSNTPRESTNVIDLRPPPAPLPANTSLPPSDSWWQPYWRNFTEAFRRIGSDWTWGF